MHGIVKAELSTGWVDPRVGFDRLGWVGSWVRNISTNSKTW